MRDREGRAKRPDVVRGEGCEAGKGSAYRARAGHQYVPPGSVPALQHGERVDGAAGGSVVMAQAPDILRRLRTFTQGNHLLELVRSEARGGVGNIGAGNHAPGCAVPMEYEGSVCGYAIAVKTYRPGVVFGREGYRCQHVDELPNIRAAYLRPRVTVPVDNEGGVAKSTLLVVTVVAYCPYVVRGDGSKAGQEVVPAGAAAWGGYDA